MPPPVIYLDTSFFFGLLDNQANRQPDARDVLEFEKQQGSHIYTSQLTINEFLVRVYDTYHNQPDCHKRVSECEAYHLSSESRPTTRATPLPKMTHFGSH